MSKRSLSNGVTLKVETRSGFDKGFFNALTTGVGTLTPLVKQLLIPSAGRMTLKLSAQLPPLASDAFLRSHLKVEAFAVPMRICYGGFESWLCGREVWDSDAQAFTRAKLPYAFLSGPGDQRDLWTSAEYLDDDNGVFSSRSQDGPGSIHDYFGVHFHSGDDGHMGMFSPNPQSGSKVNITLANDDTLEGIRANLFPYISYSLIYDEWYRNKLVQKPLFGPPSARPNQQGTIDALRMQAGNLPFMSVAQRFGVINDTNRHFDGNSDATVISGDLFNGNLFQLRQRNYGDDYFTAATPSAQEGDPAFIDTSAGGFTIGALRLQNSMQEFKERNEYASPDYLQTLVVRWGVAPSASIAQKPILIGSADFPMYTSGVEQTVATQYATPSTNPFKSVGARYGRGHAEGTDFVCDFDVKEPSYLIVLVSLVPEATYLQGFDHDMQLLTEEGSVVDLPSAQFENVGNEPIFRNEIVSSGSGVFGYVQRYLWHKLGNRNQAHGLFKTDLKSFIVQRRFLTAPQLGSDFLQVSTSDLDNVAAVAGDISKYGVMIDARVDLSVSEPLSESAIPSLSDPAQEHGYSVYVKTGGSKLA